MVKNKSRLNKTIDISVEEGREYLDKCIRVEDMVELDDILDKTIIGDSLQILNNLY